MRSRPLPHPAAGVARAAFVGLAALLAACAEPAPRELRIGLIGVTTGSMGIASGLPALEGARLAVEEINAAGGVRIGGTVHRVRLVERSIEPRAEAAAEAARALINLDSVDAIVGPQVSAQAVAAANVAEMSAVPLLAPMASSVAVTSGRRHVLRLAFVDAYQGQLLAGFAHDSLRLRRVAALYDAASPYGRDIFRLFRQTFERLGGAVVAEETFTPDQATDFRPQLRRMLAARPDAILLPNYSQYDSIQIRQVRALGYTGRFLGTDSWDPVTLAESGTSAGAVIVANWDQRTTRGPGREFVGRFEARYGHAPRTTAAATYDAIRLLVAAWQRAGTTEGTPVADSLRHFGQYEGASARFLFEGTGDPVRGGVILEFVRGSDSLRYRDLPPW